MTDDSFNSTMDFFFHSCQILSDICHILYRTFSKLYIDSCQTFKLLENTSNVMQKEFKNWKKRSNQNPGAQLSIISFWGYQNGTKRKQKLIIFEETCKINSARGVLIYEDLQLFLFICTGPAKQWKTRASASTSHRKYLLKQIQTTIVRRRKFYFRLITRRRSLIVRARRQFGRN